MPELGLEDDQREQHLQAEAPRDDAQADRPAVGRQRVGECRGCRPARSTVAAASAMSTVTPLRSRHDEHRLAVVVHPAHDQRRLRPAPGRRSPPPASASATRRVEPRLRRCSAVRAPARRAATCSPGFLRSRMPADRSTWSPFLSRPAPSATAARPTSSASSDVHDSRRASPSTWCDVPAPRQPCRYRRPPPGSPPCHAIICLNFSRAAPDAERRADLAARASCIAAGLAAEQHHARRQRARSAPRDPPGPRPLSTSMHSAISSALPTARPSGASIARDERFGPDARPRCRSTPATRQRARVVAALHERAAAALHVEHQRVAALGDLLAHHRRGNQRQALDGRGDVAQRVELLVGRRDVLGLADQAAADFGEDAA